MENHTLKIDQVDRQIIDLLQQNPNLTHTEIAKHVKRSQPTVGVRIRKLEEEGIIQFQAGVNLKNTPFIIGLLEIETKSPEKVYEKVERCPFILNAMKRSGRCNICVLLAAPRVECLDNIVNRHFRNEKDFVIVAFDIITDVMKNMVLPIDLDFNSCRCDARFLDLEE